MLKEEKIEKGKKGHREKVEGKKWNQLNFTWEKEKRPKKKKGKKFRESK